MSKTLTMNSHEFTTKYGHTLRLDPETSEPCLIIPVTDLGELACMHEALLQALRRLSQIKSPRTGEPDYSTYWISKILLASYPGSEMEGLAELLKHKNAELC